MQQALRTKLYRELGNRVRNSRNGKLTQAELSELIQLDRSTIAKIEAGRQRVTLDTLYDIARALGVEVFPLLPSIESDLSEEGARAALKAAVSPEGVERRELDSIVRSVAQSLKKKK